jgi:hypothetical protein
LMPRFSWRRILNQMWESAFNFTSYSFDAR